ncbi:MAG: ELWxxDGT repeat protein [Planctomycetota bacterium]
MSIRRMLRDFVGNLSSRRTARRPRAVSVETLESRELLAASAGVLKDIRLGADGSAFPAGQTTELISFGGWWYFAADNGTVGSEIWRTDGTEANTQLFLDVRTGVAGSFPSDFYVANEKLFFTAANTSGVRSLYASDGTTSGTVMLAANRVDTVLGTVDKTTYFLRSGLMASPGEFWRSDGTSSGTALMGGGFIDGGFGEAVVFDGTVFFSADGVNGNKTLWKIDSTTHTLAEIPGAPTAVGGFRQAGSTLYFAARAGGSGNAQLWKMTSAAAAPSVVQTSGSIGWNPEWLTNVNGTLFFSGFTTTAGRELWKSDGTNTGTILVKDIQAGAGDGLPENLTAVGTTLYFSANNGTNGQELWKSDGTSGGTVLVKDLVPGNGDGSPRGLANANGTLFFTGRNPATSAFNPWLSDGTSNGTSLVNTIVLNSPENFSQLSPAGFLLMAENPTTGREPFFLRMGNQLPTPTIAAQPATTTSQRPTFSWNTIAGAQNYEVWIRNRTTNQSPVVLTPVTGTSFTPAMDLGIGNFTIWVRAVGDVGTPASVWSSPRNFAINSLVTLNAVGADLASGFPEISWPAMKGAATYEVWVDRLDVPTSHINGTSIVSTTNYVPQFANGRYMVWVRGIAADGMRAVWSIAQSYTSTQVPGITGGINPTFDTSPTVTWTAVPGAASYEIYVLSRNTNTKVLHQTAIAATAFTLPALPAGPYRYWIRVTGAVVWSKEVDINTDGRTTVLTPTAATSDPRPVISWKKVDGSTGYRIWVNRPGVQDKIILQTVGTTNASPTTESFTPVGNLPAGNYRAWIQAINGGSMALWSVFVDFSVV